MTDGYIIILLALAVSAIALIITKTASVGMRSVRYCRRGKQDKQSISPVFISSVFAVFLCFVCICGITWAWFSSDISSPAQKMAAACYDVTVESVIKDGVEIEPLNGSYDLEENTEYTITLKAQGTVQKGGYCLIECGDTKYYTRSFDPGQTVTITLNPGESGSYTFTGVWGALPSHIDENDIILSNSRIPIQSE